MAGARDLTVRQRSVNGANVILVVVGAVLLLASFRGLLWYSIDVKPGFNVAGTGFTFTDLATNTRALHAPVSEAYFDTIAWSLAVAGTVLALAANVPSRATNALRIAAFLIGVLGLIATCYALAELFDAQRAAGGSAHSILHNASFGTGAAFAGFALVAIGGVIGPRRTR